MSETRPWTPQEYYRDIRELVKHEDNLINERVKILLTVHTLLLALSTYFLKRQTDVPVQVLVALFGVVISLISWRELTYSDRAFEQAIAAWEGSCFANDPVLQAPPIVGAIDVKGYAPSLILPQATALLWMAMACVVLELPYISIFVIVVLLIAVRLLWSKRSRDGQRRQAHPEPSQPGAMRTASRQPATEPSTGPGRDSAAWGYGILLTLLVLLLQNRNERRHSGGRAEESEESRRQSRQP